MKKIKLNNGEDFSEAFIILECEHEQIEAISSYYKRFDVEVLDNNCKHVGACDDIQNVVLWLEQYTVDSSNDTNYLNLVNRLSESNNHKFGTHGNRKPIVKLY